MASLLATALEATCPISKADEGLYKCNIFGAGESLESWLAVKSEVHLKYQTYMRQKYIFILIFKALTLRNYLIIL